MAVDIEEFGGACGQCVKFDVGEEVFVSLVGQVAGLIAVVPDEVHVSGHGAEFVLRGRILEPE